MDSMEFEKRLLDMLESLLSQQTMQFVRLERAATGSWITFEFNAMELGDLDSFLSRYMPGWEVVSRCMENPDNAGDGFEYEA